MKAEQLVEKFNSKFPNGSKIQWKPSKYSEPVSVTVKGQAFVTNNTPAVFFHGKSGWCSIDPMFMDYNQNIDKS